MVYRPLDIRVWNRQQLLASVGIGLLLCTSVLGIALRPWKATAAANSYINFQARLMSNAGAIVADGYYNVEFKLYSASSGGTALWTETYYDSNGVASGSDNRVRVENGYLTVSLGSQTSFPSTINWDQQLWITMNIGGTTQTATPTWDGEMSPRLQLTAVPYAFRAGALATTVTSHTGLLQFASSLGQDSTITLPDPGGASATVCYQNSTSCGFATGSSASYIQNGTSVQNNANFAIRSGGTGSVGGVIQGASGQTADLFQAQSWNGVSSTTLLSISSAGDLSTQNVNVAAGKSITLASGAGVFSQTYTSGSSSSAQSLSVTNSNSGGSSINVNAHDITLVGTASGGTNTNSAIKFEDPTAAANNVFYGLNFAGTGYTDVLHVGSSQIISGAGKLQDAGFDTSVTYSNLRKVGTLSVGSITTGFGTIATTNSITGSTLNASSGTLQTNTTDRIDNSGNLVNVGNITGSGAVTIATTGSSGTLALQPAAGASLTGTVTKNAATGNEVAYDLAATINKATSGNYTGLKLNVTETSAPGTGNLLLDLQVGSNSKFSVSSGGTGIFAGNLTIQGGTVTAGTTSQAGSIAIHDGNGQKATITVGDLAADRALAIPVATGSDTFCLQTLANCLTTGVTTVGTIDTPTTSADGAHISGSTIYLQTATASVPGLVSTGTQIFAGNKTFNGNIALGGSSPAITFTTTTTDAAVNFNNASTGTGHALTITGQTGATASNGGTVTVQGGAGATSGVGGTATLQGGTGGNAAAGGVALVQGGTAGGGNTNGGNVTLQGGTAAGSGVKGLIELNGGTFFTTGSYSSGSTSTITQSLVDSNSAILASATAGSLTFTVPSPTTVTAGRILYVTNSGANAFTLAGAGSSFTLNTGSTATLVWTGSAWTGAGVDASTLQNVYSNSTGSTTPEIVLDTTRNGVDIQDKTGGTIGSTQGLFNVRGVGTASTLGASLFTVNGSGQVGINNGGTTATPTISYDLSFGQNSTPSTRTIGIEAQATAATAGNALTITAGAGNTSGLGGALTLQAGTGGNTAGGGAVQIQGGTAGGGNTNGGKVTLQGGTAAGSGVKGLIELNGGTFFTTGSYSSGSTSTITQSLVDSNSAILASATAGSLTFTVPSPTTTTAGRILYVTNNGSNAFILAGAGSSFTLNTGSTATLVWTGSAWTGAGVDASTLQNVYNNSTGSTTAEIVLDTTRNGVDIQDANTTTIGSTQSLLTVRASTSAGSLGASYFNVNASGKVGINLGSTSTTPTISNDLSFGQVAGATTARTIGVEAQGTTATGGNGLTITAGTGNTSGVGGALTLQAGTGGNAAAGGVVLVQGGTAGGGNTNGGKVTLQGGTAAGSGVKGLIELNGGTYFTTGSYSSGSTSTITQSVVDSNSAILASATAGSLTFTVPSPTTTTAGRVLYVTNSGSNAFTLSGAGSTFTLNVGSTATLVWSGSAWTSAGVDASTMQNVYNNSTGGTTPEILVDSTRNGVDIQDNSLTGGTILLAVRGTATSSTLGTGLFTVDNTGTVVQRTTTNSTTAYQLQNSSGYNVLKVDTTFTNLAVNGTAEAAFGSEWGLYGAGGSSIAQSTAQKHTGSNSALVHTTGGSGKGAVNNLGAALTNGQVYSLSVYVRVVSGAFTDFTIDYSYDGNSAHNNTCTQNTSTIATTGWTRVTCVLTVANVGTSSAAIEMYGAGAGTRDFYLDDLEVRNVSSLNAYNMGTIQLNGVVNTDLSLQSAENSTTAFQIFQAGTSSADIVFTADTTNNRLTVGNATGTDTATTLFVVDSATADPTTSLVNGAMFYNSTTNKFRCRQNGSWTDCVGAGGTTTLQTAYTNSTGSTTPEILLDTTRNGLDIQDANTTLGATQALLAVRASASASTLGAGLFVVNASGKVGINTGSTSTTPTISYDLSFATANRTIGVETNSSNAAGFNLSISAGAAGSGASAFTGGTLALQGGAAGGTGNAAGGAVTITGGTAVGTSAGGTVTLQGGAASATSGSAGGGIALTAANGTATSTGGAGGGITITGGNATSSGNNAGGGITLQAGSATGTGAIGGVLVKNAANSSTAFQVQDTLGSAAFIVDTTPLNTLIDSGNGSFENTISGWALKAGSGTVARDTTQAYIGSASLKTTLTSTAANDGVKYTPSPALSAATYTLSFYIKQTAGTAFGTNLSVGWNNGTSDTNCTLSPTLSTAAVSTSGWTRYTCSFTGSASGHIYWKQADTPGSARTWFLDAVQIEQASSAKPFKDNGLSLNGVISSSTIISPTADSTTALQVANAAGTTTVLDVDTLNGYLGVGTSAPTRQLHLSISNTVVNALPFLVEQLSTGDTGIEFKTTGKNFYTGIDNSDGQFKIGSAASANGTFTMGNTGLEANQDSNLNSTQAFKAVAGSTGTLSSVSVYIKAVDATNKLIQVGVYSDNGSGTGPALSGGLLASSAAQTAVVGWNTISLTGASITSGATYWIAMAQNGTGTTFASSSGSGNVAYCLTTCYPMPTTWTQSTTSTDKLSFYATVTTSGTSDYFGGTPLFRLSDTGQATFQDGVDSTAAFQIQNSAGTSLFKVDTSNSIIYVGNSTADSTGALLVMDTSTSGTEPTGVNGAIYYSTGGRYGAGGTSTFAGKFRCYEGSIWKNCIGMRDIAESRWAFASVAGTTATTFDGNGPYSSATILGAGASGTVASSNQAESNYIIYPTTTTNGTTGGLGNTLSATLTQTRWLPKLVTRVRVDSSAVTTSRYWVALASASLTGSDGTGSFIGVRRSTGASDTNWQCASRDGTTTSVTDTGVSMTAGHYYDIIVDLTTAGTLVCSISDNGGAFTTVTKTTNLPATSTSLGLEETVTTLTTAVRNISIAYTYLEYQ